MHYPSVLLHVCGLSSALFCDVSDAKVPDSCVNDLTQLIWNLGCLFGLKTIFWKYFPNFLGLVAHYMGKKGFLCKIFVSNKTENTGLIQVVILKSPIRIFLLHLHLLEACALLCSLDTLCYVGTSTVGFIFLNGIYCRFHALSSNQLNP